jgi:exodeoxyribonuclease-1
MSKTYFFYDLETSGLSARDDRIMQFAGRRTTLDLEPVGEPYNILIALNDDTLPSPDALMVTGISPQKNSRRRLHRSAIRKAAAGRSVHARHDCGWVQQHPF